MRKINFRGFLLLTVMLLPLIGCQTSPRTSYADRSQKIDTILARAAADAAHNGKEAESLILLERMYKRDSGDPENALKYATALRETGRLNRAEMVLQPFALNESNAAVLSEYAAILSAMGNYKKSEDYARKAVLLSPESGEAYHILGIALDAQGYHPQAEVAFRRALDNWEGDPAPVLNNLGLNLAAQGFIDESLATLRRAAALAPERAEIERNIRIVSALHVQQPSKKRPAPAPDPEPETAEPAAGEDTAGIEAAAQTEKAVTAKPAYTPFYRD